MIRKVGLKMTQNDTIREIKGLKTTILYPKTKPHVGHHLKPDPSHAQSHFYNLNTRLVGYLDPLCILKMIVFGQCNQECFCKLH